MTAAFELPVHQVRRALREPQRLRRLHHSAVLASLRSIVEPDDCRFVCTYFGIDAPAFRRLQADLLDDTDFIHAMETRYREVRGTAIRLLGAAAAGDHDRCHRLLYYCTRLHRPEIVVETGVFDGFSSAFILKALRDNDRGRLCSIDLPARAPARASTDRMPFDTLPAGVDPGWIVPDALRGRWRLRLGASRAVLAPWLAELGTIDLFFHDSLHTYANMTWEYEVAWSRLAPGGLLLSDDVFWSPAFRRFGRRVGGGGRILRGMGFLRKPTPRRATRTVDASGGPAFSVIVPIAPGRQPVVLESLRELASQGTSHEVLTQIGPNPSRNRNQSIDRSRGAILAFTDDDCQVTADWLTRAAAFFDAHAHYDAVGGPQLTGEAEGPIARAGGYALASWFGTYRQCRRFKRARLRLDATQFDLTSANLFVTREAFERWGPFDERLWPNEETALLRRIEVAGGRIAYDPAIVVFHKRRGTFRGLAQQCFGYGRGRARQSHIEGALLPGTGQSVPCLFLLYLALLPLFAAWWPAALAPLVVYAATSVAVSAATAVVRADVAAAAAMPVAFLAIHVAYPAGFALETLRLALMSADGARVDLPRPAVEGTAAER